MKRSRAPRMLLILLLATGLLGLTLYVAYRLATRTPGVPTTDGDTMDEAAETAAAENSDSADVVDARQPQPAAAAAPVAQAAPSTALSDADLESMSREDLYALAEAVGVPARNRLTMTRAQLASTLADMRDQVAASS